MDNTEENKKNNKETPKFYGISAQINLSPGSKTHERFAENMHSAGCESSRAFVDQLLDNYENPQVTTDNSETIANLEQKIKDLTSENTAYEATVQNNEEEIAQLKLDLAEARNDANNNAAKAQSIELSTQGAIIIKPNPVVAYFLQEMAKETGKTPADILQALYIDDLQNPRANNLPYTVSASRIREVMAELKQKQQQ